MDYEKAYKEALERASNLHKDAVEMENNMTAKTCEIIFHELKESEDEVRKELISLFQDGIDGVNHRYNGSDCRRWLAWLEKQGDKDKLIKELGEYKVKYTQEVLERLINSRNNKDEERLRKITIAFLKDFADKGYENAVECIDWLEKQGESKQDVNMQINPSEYINDMGGNGCYLKNTTQMPTDKVEPKFKVGDWIIYRTGDTVIQIVNNKNFYESVEIWGQERTDTYNYIEQGFRLWTIEDAKDGDVLFQDLMGGKTFIYNGVNSDTAILYSFIISNDGKDVLPYHIGKPNTGIGTIEENKNIIHPATKEQRDLLFQRMHEAGYEWNDDKKELRKIEQEWSEEDKRKIDRIYSILRQAADTHAFSTSCRLIGDKECIELQDFLKFLKDRYTWKPSEEQIMVLAKASETYCDRDKNTLYSLYNDLKKLREE